jgi:hypothetical protein
MFWPTLTIFREVVKKRKVANNVTDLQLHC